jgi:alanine racemase
VAVNSAVKIDIDLERIRRNAMEIAALVGVSVYAVVKADAYGVGAKAVAETLADVVQGFCVFSLAEARALRGYRINEQPILCIGPPVDATAADHLTIGARPAVSTVEQARRLRSASPVLCVETGMQRFTCPPDLVDAALEAGDCREAFTHAVRPDQAQRLVELAGNRGRKLHAAGSALLGDPACRLDAVRPGLALYRNAIRISIPLIEVRVTRGPAGYTGFQASHHGVIPAGYYHGLRPGPCLINGRKSRVIEVGMQSAFVELDGSQNVGDEVILLGDGLDVQEIAPAWRASPQDVLVNLMRLRLRT